jgi:hypothetical protein
MTVPRHVRHGEPFPGHVKDVDVTVDVAGLDEVLVIVEFEVIVVLNILQIVTLFGSNRPIQSIF